MTHTREDFEKGSCPNCESKNISEEHNLANIGFFKGMGYFLDFPFGPDYSCNQCGASNEDACFVATAVYGDAHAPQVEILRDFRDNVLMKSSMGRTVVGLYYSGAGRSIAKFIQERLPSAIPVVRKGLDLLVEKYSSQTKE